MPELSPRFVAGLVEPARAGVRHPAQDEGPKLVPRCEFAVVVLGTGAGVSPYRAGQHELRPARSPASGAGGRAGKPLAPPRRKSPGAGTRLGSDGDENRVTSRPSTLAAQRRWCAR